MRAPIARQRAGTHVLAAVDARSHRPPTHRDPASAGRPAGPIWAAQVGLLQFVTRDSGARLEPRRCFCLASKVLDLARPRGSPTRTRELEAAARLCMLRPSSHCRSPEALASAARGKAPRA